MRYVLGLDVGIASIGWAVVKLAEGVNAELKPVAIEKMGVRVFTKAENPKTGEALALPRRLARGQRRRIHRRAHRMQSIKNGLVKAEMISEKDLAGLFQLTDTDSSPWQLRYEGLSRKLSRREWGRVLIHIAKHRGFKSNRRGEANTDNKETKGLLGGVAENSKLLHEKKYRTLGEMFWLDEKFKDHKRNQSGEYHHTVSRIELEQEIHVLFDAQRACGNEFASRDLEVWYVGAFNEQKPFSSKAQLLELVGQCTFEKGEKRIPRACYSAERFAALQKLINLKIMERGNSPRSLSPEECQLLMQLAQNTKKVTYKQLRKALGLTDAASFNFSDRDDKVKEKAFIELKAYHVLKAAITNACGETTWGNLAMDVDKLDALAFELTFCKRPDEARVELKKLGFDDRLIDAVAEITFDKVLHLSRKALLKILPFIEQGLKYDKACEAADYNHSDPNALYQQKFLPSLEELKKRNQDYPNNPVVIRALVQARKVINAIVFQYGSPYEVHIELARDLSKNFDERKKIKKIQDENAAERQRRHERLTSEFDAAGNGLNDLKLRLAIEQDWKCPYSGEHLDKDRIFSDLGYVDIDHIIPYSKSMDDSLSNKVLVLVSENRQKGDHTPFEYLDGVNNSEKWRYFVAYVEGQIKNSQKKMRLLKESWTLEDTEKFKERNLNDTRYIARFLKNYIEQNLLFSDLAHKVPVVSVNGQLTAFLRTRWGFIKNREESNRHHAVDAAVVAVASKGMIKSLSDYSRKNELKYSTSENLGFKVDSTTGEIKKDYFPKPWPEFRDDVLAAKEEIFVSRAPTHKIRGEAHAQTIVTRKYESEEKTAVKCKLTDLKVNKATGDFDLFDRGHNESLYQTIKSHLNKFDNDPKKAFVKPLYKFAKNGQGPQIKSVKVWDVLKSGLPVREGKAANGDMVRVDVFTKAEKYYLVPIYIADTIKDVLPNRAIVQSKSEAAWPEMDETFTFCFSLYPNDFMRLTYKNEVVEGYYKTCDRSNNQIEFDYHDRNANLGKNGKKGIKTVIKFEKLKVSTLGDKLSVIQFEKRQPLKFKKSKCNKVKESNYGLADSNY